VIRFQVQYLSEYSSYLFSESEYSAYGHTVSGPVSDFYIRFPYRDDNLSTGTRYPPGTRSDRYGCKDDFLPAGDTRTRSEPRRVRDVYFFPPADDPISIGYFTIAIILDCEQAKIYLFYDINYDLL
jgi:hypothetical protein